MVYKINEKVGYNFILNNTAVSVRKRLTIINSMYSIYKSTQLTPTPYMLRGKLHVAM